MEISFVNVYGEDGKPSQVALALLYAMLEERGPEVNISHNAMPSWETHVAFVSARPYPYWFLIYGKEWIRPEGGAESDKDDFDEYCIGQIYLTGRREIGIQLFRHKHLRHGYGTAAIIKLMEVVQPRGPFFANVSPANKVSQAFFESMGWRAVQWTYRCDPVFFDEPLYAGHPGLQKATQTMEAPVRLEGELAAIGQGYEESEGGGAHAARNPILPEIDEPYSEVENERDVRREKIRHAQEEYIARRKSEKQEQTFREQHDGVWEVPAVKPRPEGE